MTVTPEIFSPGKSIVVHWEANSRGSNPNGVKSNKTSAGKTKKIILPVDDAKGVP